MASPRPRIYDRQPPAAMPGYDADDIEAQAAPRGKVDFSPQVAPAHGGRRGKGVKKYHDESVFDLVCIKQLPSGNRGRYLLLLSFGLQGLLIIFGFIQHHWCSRDFSCCNMWAVIIAILFLVLQWPYYAEWCSKLGTEASWHRANIFAPHLIFAVLFLMWGAANLSMMAHVTDHDFFSFVFDKLNGLENAAFALCTASVIPIWFFLIIVANAHRNILGTHYYAPGEQAKTLIVNYDTFIPTRGTFHYRDLLTIMSRITRVDTPQNAKSNVTFLVAIVVCMEVPFYVFSGISYSGTKSIWVIIFISLGALVCLLHVYYLFMAFTTNQTLLRQWHRENLMLPVHSIVLVVIVYFGTQSTVFFNASNNNLWENVTNDLSKGEKAIFSLNFVTIVSLYLVQTLLSYTHRKAWAEGTAKIKDGYSYDQVMDEDKDQYFDEDENLEYYDDDPQPRPLSPRKTNLKPQARRHSYDADAEDAMSDGSFALPPMSQSAQPGRPKSPAPRAAAAPKSAVEMVELEAVGGEADEE